jgi:hypothetical protein
MGNADSRWWEFYFIRYAMGTVIGAIILFQLFYEIDSLRELLFLPKSETYVQGSVETGAQSNAVQRGAQMPLSIAHVIVYAAYGLAYCYLASAPVLFFHSSRFFLKVEEPAIRPKRLIIALAFSVVTLLGLMVLSIWLGHLNVDSKGIVLSFFLAFGLGLAMLGLLCGVLVITYSRHVYHHYELLDSARRAHTGELVDSYRHLREHGNSFFIVALEIFFAFFLCSLISAYVAGGVESATKAQLVTPLAFGLFAWVSPGVVVWLAATAIERQFVERRKGSTPPATG